ncbi:hypothetical protein C8R47DRAFT_1068055 [Mycena vitilis]|nr:hypothetical protein C8R47DRAFT_1068055 [Mycena vitilis]
MTAFGRSCMEILFTRYLCHSPVHSDVVKIPVHPINYASKSTHGYARPPCVPHTKSHPRLEHDNWSLSTPPSNNLKRGLVMALQKVPLRLRLKQRDRTKTFPCFTSEVISMVQITSDPPVWLCGAKRKIAAAASLPLIAGMVVGVTVIRPGGVYKRLEYLVDDGTQTPVLECFYEFPTGEPADGRCQRVKDHGLMRPRVGSSVMVVGEIDDELDYRRLRIESIDLSAKGTASVICPSSNDEPIHWNAVQGVREHEYRDFLSLQSPKNIASDEDRRAAEKVSYDANAQEIELREDAAARAGSSKHDHVGPDEDEDEYAEANISYEDAALNEVLLNAAPA